MEDIYQGNVTSLRHAQFEKGEVRKMRYQGYGPLRDNHVDDVMSILNKHASHIILDNQIKKLDYNMYVLAPEIIIWSIVNAWKMTLKDAEDCFARGLQLEELEQKQLNEEIMVNGMNISQADHKLYEEKRQRLLHRMN